MDSNFQTPILFLIFNRPETAQMVFNEIKKQKPKYLYVAADGSRQGKIGEIEKCQQARDIIKQINWDCELKTLFREENLGCGKAVSSAIDWFFSQVEEGIILEDDCVPDQSFFGFCEKMLDLYRDDYGVFMISGNNNLPESFSKFTKNDYYFSRYCGVWGWATWRRAWQKYDFNMPDWKKYRNFKVFNRFFLNFNISNYFINVFDKEYFGKIDTWDFQLFFTCLKNNGLVVTPNKNLISNIGWVGAHTEACVSKFDPITHATKIDFDILSKKSIVLNKDMENKQFDYIGASMFNYRRCLKNLLNSCKFIMYK